MIANDATIALPALDETGQQQATAEQSAIPITCRLKPISSRLCTAEVVVSAPLHSSLQEATVELFMHHPCDGFALQQPPRDYMIHLHQGAIEHKMTNFLVKHSVIDHLIEHVYKQKLLMANYPRLHEQYNDEEGNVVYRFELSTADPVDLKEWRNFAFQPPKRKRYKDLDKQVCNFLEHNAAMERSLGKQCTTIQEGDWVHLQLIMLNKDEQPIHTALTTSFWLKIRQSHLQDAFMRCLLEKTVGSDFITDLADYEESLSSPDSKRYLFHVTIKQLVRQAYFSVDMLKATFKLKNMSDVHNKLIEVFSYRNDLSQRKAIIEELYHLLLSKHRFQVPKHLILRRQEDLLRAVSQQPDYHVYRAQKDFLENITLLAEKQLKEEIITDQIGYKEQISIDTKDINHYIQLLNNKKLKEFIYFRPAIEKLEDPDQPISTSLLWHAVLREKTLNYMIHAITR